MTKYPMDPDTFQMKDLKRRVRKIEVLATSTASSWARWKNRIRNLEDDIADIAESLTFLQENTFVRAVPKESSVPSDESEEGNH